MPTSLDSLLKRARHTDSRERRAAVRELAGHPTPEVVAALVDSLSDEDRSVTDSAVNALLTIGGEKVARAVLPLLAHEEITQRSLALDILIALRTAACAPLMELLAHEDRELRKSAAEVLGESGHAPAGTALAAHVADPDPVVRAAVTGALAGLDHRPAIGALLTQWHQEPVEWVRFAIAGAVCRLGSEGDMEGLLTVEPEGSPVWDMIRAELQLRRLKGA